MSWVGKLTDYPNPVTSAISSRVIAEFGTISIVMAAAALIVASFLASAVYVVTGFIYVAAVYVFWPILRPFLQMILGTVSQIFEIIWDNIPVLSDREVFSKLCEFYTFGGGSASLRTLRPIMITVLILFLIVRIYKKTQKLQEVGYMARHEVFTIQGTGSC
uniref:Chloroplast protein-transporting ATPase n=1 Tax=Opuntia streptacantha TaxID=393608 RepID=A0A7C9CV06_OPUST